MTANIRIPFDICASFGAIELDTIFVIMVDSERERENVDTFLKAEKKRNDILLKTRKMSIKSHYEFSKYWFFIVSREILRR